MINFTGIIFDQCYEKIFLRIGGNHFKRYITYANYDFYVRQMLSIFEIFVNKVIQKLLHIEYCTVLN